MRSAPKAKGSTPMRIVLDTNVLVSALLSSQGPPGQLMRLWQSGLFTLVSSHEQAAELGGVLSRDHLAKRMPPGTAETLLDTLAASADYAQNLPEINLSPDPKDNFILAMAIAGKADLLVTGDKRDLLSLNRVDGIPIVPPAEAVQRIQQSIASHDPEAG